MADCPPRPPTVPMSLPRPRSGVTFRLRPAGLPSNGPERRAAVVISALGLGVLVGFFLGLFSFKIKSRWCPRHGMALRCPDCTALNTPYLSKDRR